MTTFKKNSDNLDLFFVTQWYKFVKKFRWAIFGISIAWTLASVISANNYGYRTEEDLIFYDLNKITEDQPLTIAYRNMYEKFPKDNSFDVYSEIFIGFDYLDKNQTSNWDASNFGKAVFSDNFTGFEDPLH
jgi:hypothetical protein